MGMHQVHHHADAEAMRLVHEPLQVLRRAETRTDGIKTRHLIAERTVIRMLLDAHQLDGVIPQLGNAGQDIRPELIERRHPAVLHAHAHMRLVNQRMLDGRGFRIFPLVPFFRFPHLRRKQLGHVVLHHPPHISRNPFTGSSLPFYPQLIEHPVPQRLRRQPQFPHAARQRLQAECLTPLPSVRFPNQVNCRSVGRPFAEHPALLRPMQTKIQMIVENVRQTPFPVGKLQFSYRAFLLPATDRRQKRL